ncbi:STAS domain-containing protein [Schlegelella sp. S2-27]|uniref:STAS domain-containing protein n=1 Tax=Caldimonas mangrovi TaxID=2944811 RepID=A0ABT0YMG9_9BURK|nr:STAS domain-containing protein [Caldimonas mangrovi]MCM5679927.1 STAS domain-containing protein [Caldimonas mangrovi]
MSTVSLSIDGEMTVQRAAELKPVLLGALADSAARIELDLSAVTELDSAGVQLLFMLKSAALGQQRNLRVCRPSPAVEQVFALLGLEGCFDGGEAEPAEEPR